MDRQGFEILAMGFTGEEALRWKFKYSDAFAAMEAELKKPALDAATAQLAALLSEVLKSGHIGNKVLVDYDPLCRLARMTRSGHEKIAEGQKLLEEAEQVGLDLEKQCGRPLVCFDIPEERRARHRARQRTAPPPANPRPPRPAAPPDPWEAQARAFLADRAEITSAELLAHCGIEPGDQTQSHKNRAAKLLRSLGYWVYSVNRGARTVRVYQRGHRG